jgi:hypothetical protein
MQASNAPPAASTDDELPARHASGAATLAVLRIEYALLTRTPEQLAALQAVVQREWGANRTWFVMLLVSLPLELRPGSAAAEMQAEEVAGWASNGSAA